MPDDDLNDVLQAVNAGPDVMEYCITADTPPCEYCLHLYDAVEDGGILDAEGQSAAL